ncbi:Aste57867_9780 [Aphanomyces stellatus]|uniref:Aste57867_9780 protein n=1 Tax=Aphanomyces stellatus TaxID=120398 RepID=A0A485KNR4_9STRA|nr:hypothetical protein As57867_009741 [Aphanomyces stellatus]VFT86659.1 Aste57867_9780 [Aphanomyces stellatus]
MHAISAMFLPAALVIAVSAADHKWLEFPGNAVANRDGGLLATYTSIATVDDCKAQCLAHWPATTGISHRGYDKSCACQTNVFSYNPVWSKAVDLKATALLKYDDNAFCVEGDFTGAVDVSNFKGNYNNCGKGCRGVANAFVWVRGPLGDMLSPTGEPGMCYCKKLPSGFYTRSIAAAPGSGKIFCQM